MTGNSGSSAEGTNTAQVWTTQSRHKQVVAIVGDMLAEQPTAQSIQACMNRLRATLAQLAQQAEADLKKRQTTAKKAEAKRC